MLRRSQLNSARLFRVTKFTLAKQPVLTASGPFCRLVIVQEGASSANGLVMGSYVHGIFADNEFRRAFLNDLAASRGRTGQFAEVDFDARVDAVLDQLAGETAKHLDMDGFGTDRGA